MALIGSPIVASQPVDTELSTTSKNPVENRAITNTLMAGTQATKMYHLGFYLDGNGDLSYDADDE